MRFHTTAVMLFAVLLAGPALAQTPMRARPPEAFKYLSAKQVDALTDKPGPGAQTGFPVDHEDYDVEYAQRSDKGKRRKVHPSPTFYFLFRGGGAILVLGAPGTSGGKP